MQKIKSLCTLLLRGSFNANKHWPPSLRQTHTPIRRDHSVCLLLAHFVNFRTTQMKKKKKNFFHVVKRQLSPPFLPSIYLNNYYFRTRFVHLNVLNVPHRVQYNFSWKTTRNIELCSDIWSLRTERGCTFFFTWLFSFPNTFLVLFLAPKDQLWNFPPNRNIKTRLLICS